MHDPKAASSPHDRVSTSAAREVDHLIIGAGPIGLELAIAMKKAGLEYIQLDAGQIGHQISRFPPGTTFFSSNERIAIAGVPIPSPWQTKSTREEYLAYLRAVADQFNLEVNTYESVVEVEHVLGGFIVRTMQANGLSRSYRTSRVILVTGGTASPRQLGIPGEDLPHVTHDLGDVHQYWRRRVVVIGGRNSAVEAALRCYHAGAQVTLSYRREQLHERLKYWLRPEIEMLIRSGAVKCHYQTEPVSISPTHIALRSTADDRELEIAADHVLLMVGYRADMSLARAFGVALRGEAEVPQFDEATMETNVPGVYIAGTATAGTQARFSVYIENSHIHVSRIVAALTGAAPPPPPKPIIQAES